MKKEEIFLSDWQRILLGNTPWEFMLEVLGRTIIVFLIFLVVLRLLGKRMNAQLTISEFAVMVTLGAIIAVPMQMPDRGMLPGIVILFCVLFFQRGMNWLAFKNRKIEVLTQGDVATIVKDGVLQIDAMERHRLSKDQVFAALRSQNYQHLGQVKRVYMEACGLFSVYEQKEPKPGLTVLPHKDEELSHEKNYVSASLACTRCGFITQKEEHASDKSCPVCACSEWVAAMA